MLCAARRHVYQGQMPTTAVILCPMGITSFHIKTAQITSMMLETLHQKKY